MLGSPKEPTQLSALALRPAPPAPQMGWFVEGSHGVGSPKAFLETGRSCLGKAATFSRMGILLISILAFPASALGPRFQFKKQAPVADALPSEQGCREGAVSPARCPAWLQKTHFQQIINWKNTYLKSPPAALPGWCWVALTHGLWARFALKAGGYLRDTAPRALAQHLGLSLAKPSQRLK